MIDATVAVLGSGLLFLGLGLATVGLYGLLRKPDIFEQLHAAALVTGPGSILVLLAGLATGNAEIMTSALLVLVFVLVTSSLSTHAIALAAWRARAAGNEIAELSARARASDAPAGDPVTGAMRVVVAYDATPDADVAVRLVASLAWPPLSHVRLVAAIEGDLPALSSVATDMQPSSSETDELAAALDAARRAIERPGLTVDGEIRRGRPAEAIVEEASGFGAHLVVVGSRGLGWVRSMLGTSVAAEVLDTAPCPVLVARTTSVQRVLLPTDGSGASVAATELVAQSRIFEGTRVHVVSVTPAHQPALLPTVGAIRDRLADARARRWVEQAALDLRDAGRTGHTHVRAGDPATEIIDVATTESVDLIVLGSRGRTGLRRALLGSMARDVLSTAPMSVLVVRDAPPATSGAAL